MLLLDWNWEMDSKICTGISVSVPKGLDEGSQAIYCLECVKKMIRPVLSAIARMATEEGYGMSWYTGIFTPKITERSFRPIISFPNGTVRFFLHPQAVDCQATIS